MYAGMDEEDASIGNEGCRGVGIATASVVPFMSIFFFVFGVCVCAL